MATACFCGCGREISGLKKRANNTVAAQVAEDVQTLTGALERGEAGPFADAVATSAGEGRALLGQMTMFLHGAAGSSAGKGATRSWLGAARKLRGELIDATTNPWLPTDPGSDVIANTGVRTTGVVVEVRRHGFGGNDRVAKLDLAIEVRDADGETVLLRQVAAIAVIQVPRVGDRVEVSYDPTDDSRFVHRPIIER